MPPRHRPRSARAASRPSSNRSRPSSSSVTGTSDGDATPIAARLATPRYRSLVPATPPGPGQQYAFEVDLDRCSGCKACVMACHTLNGLDEAETWRDVGLLVGGSRIGAGDAARHGRVPPLPRTGVHDRLPGERLREGPDHGHRQASRRPMLRLPVLHAGLSLRRAEVSPGQGHRPQVRHVFVAAGRGRAAGLRAGVSARGDRDSRRDRSEQVIEDAEAAVFLPAAPDPQITLPTTTYKTRRPFPRNLLPADYFRVNPQHAHWPLVVMLVLTQLSVGAFVVGLVFERLIGGHGRRRRCGRCMRSNALGVRAAGAWRRACSTWAGRSYAFRAVLGLRHSWLSREIVAFGLFAGLATAYACTVFAWRFAAPEMASAANGPWWIAWLGLERRRNGRRGRLLLGDDLRLHAARVLELRPRRRSFRVDRGAAWGSPPCG